MSYKFSDIVDIKAVQSLMDNLWKATGIPTGIIDVDGNVLVATGWQVVCTKFHRQDPEAVKRCRESDAYLTSHLQDISNLPPCGYVEYLCRNGMIDIGIPIIIEGKHMANIFLGQFFYEPPDIEFFRAQARRFGFDEAAYLEALEAVPIFTRARVEDILAFNTGLVSLLTSMGVEKLQQLEAKEAVRESERRHSTLMANLPGMAYRCQNDRNWTMEFVSQGCRDLTGYAPEALLGNKEVTYGDLILPDDQEEVWRRIQEKLKTRGPFELEYRIRTAEGLERWVWEMGRPVFDRDGALLALEGFITDTTERKQAEQDLAYREAFEALIAGISTRFVALPANRTDLGIETALRELGEFAGVDRSYVFRFSEDMTQMDNSHEWCQPGIEPQIGNLQGVTASEIPWFLEQIQSKDVVYVPRVQDLPAEARAEQLHWVTQGIRSVVAVPIISGSSLNGFLGFDTVRSMKTFGAKDFTLLQTAAGIFGSALERERTEAAFRQALVDAEEARDKIDAILKSVAEGLIVTDLSNRVILMNRTAEQLSGTTLGEAFSRPMASLFPGEGLSDHIAGVLTRGPTGDTFEWDMTAPRTEKRRTIQARTATVQNRAGVKTGTITTLRDVSRERELDRMKNEFISTAAHELRTPLTSILGFSELLLNREEFGPIEPPQEREYLETIYHKAESLSRIVSDLLDLSRIQSGQLITLEAAPCEITGLLDRTVCDHRRKEGSERFELMLPEEPVTLCADEGKLAQVLDNLISNALKFSPPQSKIQVAGKVSGDRFVVSVTDRGKGMTPQQLDRVFDKFYRVDASDTAAQGLGLGMSIAKNIVEAHGGRIWVDSAPGTGTSVSFTLPLDWQTATD